MWKCISTLINSIPQILSVKLNLYQTWNIPIKRRSSKWVKQAPLWETEETNKLINYYINSRFSQVIRQRRGAPIPPFRPLSHPNTCSSHFLSSIPPLQALRASLLCPDGARPECHINPSVLFIFMYERERGETMALWGLLTKH